MAPAAATPAPAAATPAATTPATPESESKPEEDKAEEHPEDLYLEATFSDYAEDYEYVDSASLLSGFMAVGPQSDTPGLAIEGIQVLYASDYNGNKLVDLTSSVYLALKNLVINVASGAVSATTLEQGFAAADLSGYRWTASDLGMSLFADETRTSINKPAAEAALNQIYDASYAVKSLIRDCPYEMFWFGNKYTMARTYTPSVSYDPVLQDYVMTLNGVSVKIDLQVAGEYRGGSDYTTDAAKIASISGAMTNARNIINAAAGMGDMEKLYYFWNQICSLVSYNYNTDANGYGNPWQLIYVFDGDASTNVVCEGYAKAFQYLCDESFFSAGDFAVYSVAGTFQTGASDSGTGHLWNIVHMNGKNYLVDLTNCDGASPHQNLFMVQAVSGSVDEGFVFSSGSTNYLYKYYDDTRKIYSNYELDMIGSGVHTHTPVVTAAAVSPTLFRNGATEEVRCSECHEVLSAAQILPMTGLQQILQKGATGEDVQQIQKVLIGLGYQIDVADGIFGYYTDNAVRQFQQDNGIYADGAIGNTTLGYLRAMVEAAGGSGGSGGDSGSGGGGGSSSGTYPPLTRYLSRGMTGEDVRVLQQMLQQLGYSINADGDFGPYTEQLVTSYQSSHGIYPDAVVGNVTYSSMIAQLGGSSAGGNPSGGGSTDGGSSELLSVGSQGDAVVALQQKLNSLGYTIGVDGIFGVNTQAVVQAFQSANGVYPDGIVGPVTMAVLNSR